MTRKPNQNPHAILIPYPLQGHIIPFINLAINLSSHHNFTITFINTQSNHQKITQANNNTDLFAESLHIRYAVVTDGFPLDFDRSLRHDEFFEYIHQGFDAHVDEIVGQLIEEDESIDTLITDTFYAWTSKIAGKYGLASVSFFTEPALVLNLYYHYDLLKENGHALNKKNREDAIEYVPGVKSIRPTDLMSYLQETVDSSTKVVHTIINKAFTDLKSQDFIICNTVQELEQQSIKALNKYQPFYAIGPIFPPGFTKSSISTSLWSESDCTQWLTTKPPDSVLYISFGSYAHTSKKEIEEIAYGLILSQVNFVWAIRPDIVSSDESEYLPAGFEKEVAGRGLIVEWCCQIEVLSNPSIGGFLTHCGWNSILESVWAGVPMIGYPLLTDQFTNRKLIVDEFGIGINLRDKETLTRDEVSEKVRFLMEEKTSEKVRMQLENVRAILKGAVQDGGSSATNLKQFKEDLKVKIGKNKTIS